MTDFLHNTNSNTFNLPFTLHYSHLTNHDATLGVSHKQKPRAPPHPSDEKRLEKSIIFFLLHW